MKRIISILALILAPVMANAFTRTGGNIDAVGTLADETALAYSANYDVSPNLYGGNRVSAVVVYTSATLATVAFSSQSYTDAASSQITATAHGLYTAVPVLFRVLTGAAPTALTGETTYYAIRTSADIVELATTSVKAQALDPIILGAKSATGTYSLIPLAITGTPSFKWMASNDGTNWADVNTSSITMSAYTAGGAVSAWDFEWFNFANLRLAVTGPTTGGIYLKAVLDIKP